MQKLIEKDIHVIQIYTSQIEEIEDSKLNFCANNSILISDLAKDFYKDLSILFINFELKDKKSIEKYIYKPDTNSKNTPKKFLNLIIIGIGIRKKFA